MKKMRRMIPALCMLLVSAIMLSTASYAWFTMNDQVTATGMQIQAKATGSLVIGTEPLTDADKQRTTVTLDTTKMQLRPITWLSQSITQGEDTLTPGWYQAGEDVDTDSGKAGTLLPITANDWGDDFYFDQIVYLGFASDTDSEAKHLEINISSPVHMANDIAYHAYSAAIYVYEENVSGSLWGKETDGTTEKVPAAGAEPLKVISVADWDGSTLHTVTLDGEFVIPGVVGKQNDTVGLKVVIRVFVDGNLILGGTNENVPVYTDEMMAVGNTEIKVLGSDGAVQTTTVAALYGTFNRNQNVAYYNKVDSTTEGAVQFGNDYYLQVSDAEIKDGAIMTSGAYFVMVSHITSHTAEYCINSNKVPTDTATLDFSFKIK